MVWKKWVNKIKKWEKSPAKLLDLFSPINRIYFFKKTSFCSLRNKMSAASLAVETAFILPIFFLSVVAMISMIDIYKVQTEHLTALCEKAKEAGMYTYGMTDMEEITLPDVYSYKVISGVIPLPKILMQNKVTVHTWTGIGEQFQAENQEIERIVYVTESGSVYHRNLDCRYLNVTLNQVSGSSIAYIRNDQQEKYTACEICSNHQKPAGMVYVTQKGNRFHNNRECSGLKRTVRMVTEKQMQGKYHACSKCG